MPTENKTVQVNLRLQPSLKAAAERAAARDHRSLTSLMEKLLADHLRTQPTLEDWHLQAISRLNGELSDKKSNQAEFGTLVRSYCVHTADGDKIPPASLISSLRSVQTSLGGIAPRSDLFYVYQNNPTLIPHYTFDKKLSRGTSEEILEHVAVDTKSKLSFWRVSPLGLATHISSHVEDGENKNWEAHGLRPGKWFWPYRLTYSLAELIHHAAVFSEKFPSAERVEFRCEWSGLLERQISDPDQMGYDSGKISHVDSRVTIGEWPVLELRRSWPEIVAELGGPVTRLFDSESDYSADFIRENHLPRLRGE